MSLSSRLKKIIKIALAQPKDADELIDVVNNEKLKRADNGTWEVSETDVEYIGPDQHGSIFGTIFRRYYAIPDAAGTGDTQSLPLGFTLTGRVVDLRGVSLNQDGVTWQPMPYVDFGGAARSIELKVLSPNIVIIAGSVQDWLAGGFVWLDYTK